VPAAHVEATLPFLRPALRAMAGLQRLTGMRPGEVLRLRACDLDVTGPLWAYRPGRHKTAWRGRDRVVVLGPQAQAVVRPFLTTDLQAYLFSPARTMAEFRAEQRAARKTPVPPSQRARAKAAPRKRPGQRYTADRYAKAVAKACARAGVPHWSPNQLRHLYATEVRKRFGLEASQVALGHSRADVTQVYAERDRTLAERVAREIG
jgi:integrase